MKVQEGVQMYSIVTITFSTPAERPARGYGQCKQGPWNTAPGVSLLR